MEVDVNQLIHTWLSEPHEWWFDLDGTLIEGVPYQFLLEQISDITGASLEVLLDHYHEGFKGFDHAQEFHLALAHNDTDRLRVVAAHSSYITHSTMPSVIDGVCRVLELLQSVPRRLVCYIRGHKQTQLAKLQSNDLRKYFHRVRVVSTKDALTLKKNYYRCPGPTPKMIMIGNSWGDDMAPAAGIALGRVFVKKSYLSAFQTPPASTPDDVVSVDSVANLIDPIERFIRQRG